MSTNDTEPDRAALERRVARAKARLQRRLATLENRGQTLIADARSAAKTAAFVMLGVGGLAALAVLGALTRPRRAQVLAAGGHRTALALTHTARLTLTLAGFAWMLLGRGRREIPIRPRLALSSGATNPPQVHQVATTSFPRMRPNGPKS